MLAGCSHGDGTTFQDLRAAGDTPEQRVVELDGDLIAALARYDSCEAFLADVKAEALEHVGPYGFGGGGFDYAAEDAARSTVAGGATADAESSGGDDAANSAPVDEVSGTNVQEEGVDEPDIVKTDGSLMAVVDEATLHLIDVSDPGAPVLVSSTPLAGWNAQVLLHDDRLVVIQDVAGPWDWGGEPSPRPADTIGTPSEAIVDELLDDSGGDEPAASGRGIAMNVVGAWPSSGIATVTQVDVSDPADPQVERTWTIEGSTTSARLVDGVLRVVLQGNATSSLPFVYPSGASAEASAEAANRRVIEDSTIDDWVPSLTLTGPDGEIVDGVDGPIAPCDRLYRPSTFSGFGMVSVLTADLSDDGLSDGAGVGVLSTGETVYASTDDLYVATHRWDWGQVMPFSVEDDSADSEDGDSDQPDQPTTEIHRFSTTGTEPADYVASGSVTGTLLDQWSMSEHDDHLRVAVTIQPPWTGRTMDVPESSSSVVVLATDGDELVETGRVDDLGKGEQIYAVRFMGDQGYVVTFRQVDPLYSLDLSDPTAPVATGELKITGFSSYLHPVGDGLLLGVGQEATEEGRITGGQVSLFDVSDPASPQRLAQIDLGEGASSEVEGDHRAFLFWDGLALVPYTAWNYDPETGEQFRSGLIGIDVTEDDALSERGTVTHLGLTSGAIGEPAPVDGSSSTIPRDPNGEWNAQIRRSVVIGDTLLTVSGKGILATDLADLEPLRWTPLSR